MKTQEIKDKYVARAKMHQEADDYVQGHYWQEGKGCCVGCLAHSYTKPHKALSRGTGVPEWVYHLSDRLFEGLNVEEAKRFPLRFVEAMPVGLSEDAWREKVLAPFLITTLRQTLATFDHDKHPDVKQSIDNVTALWQRDDIGIDDFKSAAGAAATDAAWAAASAASAADAATWAAAKAAAWAAAKAAWAAAWAAGAAADAAAGAWAADAWASDAAMCSTLAEDLIEIMEEAGGTSNVV